MIKIKAHKEKINKKRLEEFEALINHKLPKDYYDFLININGGKPELNIINAEKFGRVSVSHFLGLDLKDKNNDLEKNIQIYKNRIPEGFLPIAESEGGNLICLNVKSDSNLVYFWDHEQETEEGETPDFTNMHKISDSFTSFLNGLEKFDPSKVEVKKEDVISAWIDPDFLKEINKQK